MAGPSRLLIVARRYWPYVGGTETRARLLATEFARRGVGVTVATARIDGSWPGEVNQEGVRVVRLPWRPGWLGRRRYLRSLGAWLRSAGGRFEVAYVLGGREEMDCTVGAMMGSGCAVVGGGISCWMEDSDDARVDGLVRPGKNRGRQPAAWVAMSNWERKWLIQRGISASATTVIPPGVEATGPKTMERQLAARRTLEETNLALFLPREGRLALSLERLAAGRGLETLIGCWERIAFEEGNAQLWLVGDGPLAAGLGDLVSARGLQGRVVAPGAFEAVDDLLAAADVCVLPGSGRSGAFALLEALAAGTPVVASDHPARRELVEGEREALLVPPGDEEALYAAVRRCWSEREEAEGRAIAGGRRVEADFRLATMVDGHQALFERLTGRKW